MSSDPPADVVFVHSSDIHVDDGYTARLHGGDGTRGLNAVLETARHCAADLVLLAGDVFEHNRLPLDLLDRAAAVLAAAGRPVVMLPGNHDPAVAGSVYHRGGFAELANVHVLGVTAERAVVFDHLALEVWGRAHRDYADMAPLETARARRTRWQVAMAHGHYARAEALGAANRPSWIISDAAIAATGADYVALGHWNRPVRVGEGAVPAYYSGSPDLAGTVNLVRLTAAGAVEVSREALRRPFSATGPRPPPPRSAGRECAPPGARRHRR